jgi:hypothetical protein
VQHLHPILLGHFERRAGRDGAQRCQACNDWRRERGRPAAFMID